MPRNHLISCLVALSLTASLLAAPKVRSPTVDRDSGEDRTFFKYRFNSGVGVRITNNAQFAIHASFPMGLFAPKPLYLGPSVDFVVLSPGYSLGVLLGTWYELRIRSSPRLGVWLGANAGPVFSSNGMGLTSNAFALYADGALVQEVDDLVSVKAQFRPGIVAGAFSFLVSFCLSFRFY